MTRFLANCGASGFGREGKFAGSKLMVFRALYDELTWNSRFDELHRYGVAYRSINNIWSQRLAEKILYWKTYGEGILLGGVSVQSTARRTGRIPALSRTWGGKRGSSQFRLGCGQ
jgi:hypothetical protein